MDVKRNEIAAPIADVGAGSGSGTGADDRQGKAAARRERVIQAARTLFANHGFHGTGMAQISREAGVLVGQIYRDFANKEAIVAAIVERDLAEFLDDAGLCEMPRAPCCDTAVRDWIARFVACHEIDDKRLVIEIMAESMRNERIAAIFHQIDQRLRDELCRALQAVLPPDVPPTEFQRLTDMIVTISSGVFHQRLTQPGGICPELIAGLVACIDREIDRLQRVAA